MANYHWISLLETLHATSLLACHSQSNTTSRAVHLFLHFSPEMRYNGIMDDK